MNNSHPIPTGVSIKSRAYQDASPMEEAKVVKQSPVDDKLDQLRKTLYCAEEGVHLLAEKLNPIRIHHPRSTGEGSAATQEWSPLEQQLESLISVAARLSSELSDLRGELRI